MQSEASIATVSAYSVIPLKSARTEKHSSAFSKFYSEIHIIDEKDCNKKNSWLYLCKATKIILQKHLDILGIESVEFM